MDPKRFDDVAKALANDADRRTVLKRAAGGLVGGLLALAGVNVGEAADKKGKKGKKPCPCDKTTEKCVKDSKGKWTCVPKTPVCTPNYAKCDDGKDCCSGYCDTTKGYGKCAPKPVTPPCTPKTCSYYKGKCGTFDDKCGGTVTCSCPTGKTCDKGYCKEQKPAPVCGNWCSPYDDKISCAPGCYCKKYGDKTYKCAPNGK